jgi:hypothetical protein
LDEAEIVVDEQQHVSVLVVSKIWWLNIMGTSRHG